MIHYDRQGNLIGHEEFARLLSDSSYSVLHTDVIGVYLVSTRWIGVDDVYGMTHSFATGKRNLFPMIFESIILPSEFENMGEFFYGVYSHRFPREDQAAFEHAKALRWLRDNLEPRA